MVGSINRKIRHLFTFMANHALCRRALLLCFVQTQEEALSAGIGHSKSSRRLEWAGQALAS